MTSEHTAATDLAGGDKAGGAAATVPPSGDSAAPATRRRRINWTSVLPIAADLHRDEVDVVGVAPGVRRVHYGLFSHRDAIALGYANTNNVYKALSRATTAARDAGAFPHFLDDTRTLHYPSGDYDPADAIRRAARYYTVDREQFMPVRVVIVAEKDGVVPLLRSRFGWLHVTATRGYASVSHAREIAGLHDPDRDTVALYVGDYDPTGLDIPRALATRLPFPLVRVALLREHIARFNLPPAPAKSDDSRRLAMIRDTGESMQVELDALPSLQLLGLVADAITEQTGVPIRPDGMPDWPDVDAMEAEQRDRLRVFADGWTA